MRYYFRRWLILCILQIVVVWTVFWALRDARVQTLRSSLSDWLSDQNMSRCSFRKLPMVFEHGHQHYYVVWETSCPAKAFLLEWWADYARESEPSMARHYIEPQLKRIDDTHHRYTAIIGPVGNASQIHYRATSYSMSTKHYSISRRSEAELTQVLVISDNQNGPTEFRNILSSIRRHYGSHSTPDLILHVGDSVQNVRKLNDWQKQFFSPLEDGGGYHHSSPLVFVPGNHDHDKARTSRNGNVYADMYHGIDATEDLGKPLVANGTYHRFYHTTSLGSARCIVLDAECPSAEQSEFLQRELQSEAFQAAHFRIVAIHIPPYIEFWDPYTWNHKNEKRWGEHIRLEYDALFRKYRVDVVISGHQHNYMRATVPRKGSATDTGSITYAIVGGAGGTLDLVRVENWHMYNVTYLDHHFVSLEIKNNQLRWLAKNTAGSIIDQFSIAR